MNHLLFRSAPIALLLAASCGGGGGGGGGSATPPSNLQYPRPVELHVVDVLSAPNTPTYDGDPSTFSIAPALPSGLNISSQTGSITGTPSQASARKSYTVTAHNSGGNTTATLEIGVSLPARFAYALNQADSTITVLTVDADTGRLHDIGYHVAPGGQVGPERMAVHPNGRFVHVA